MAQRILSVIGGGASGMAAAIEAARCIKSTDAEIKVEIYERLPKVGKKILATGNGRCNILNIKTDMDKYSGDKAFISGIFSQYDVESNIEFFKSIGLYLKEDADGRLYPMSNQASSVLDALRFETEHLGIEIHADTKIERLTQTKNGYLLNDSYVSDAVIIAGGGKSAKVQGSDGSCFDLLSSLGIKVKPTFPALTGIVLKKKNKFLKGTRAHGEILVVENGRVIAASSGELQYTDYGISGIPAMEVSRAVSAHFTLHKKGRIILSVNSLPDFSQEEIYSFLTERKKNNPDLKCEDLLSGLMPKKLGVSKLAAATIGADTLLSSLTKNKIALLTEIINSEIFEVSGVLGFDHSQVTAGGADTGCFDKNTLESKTRKGLFACGELLDVDAGCGGYNLAWAWSSGRCAGANAVKYLAEIE